MFVYRAGGNDQETPAGIFTNLGHEDKQAFFSLLDEYFASRPHLVGGGDGGGSQAAAAASPPSRPKYPPAPNPSSRPGGSTSTSATPPSHSFSPPPSSGGGGSGGGPTAFVNSGLGKVAGNQHVSGALGKIGAGSFAKSMDKKFNTPASRHGTGMSAPARPPASGTTSSRTIGHIDTSSAGAAVKSMWTNDPNYQQQPASTAGSRSLPPPSRGAGAAVLPPPTRNVNVSPTPDPVPAYSSAGKVKALYDYEGGDDNDLPMQAGQIYTVVEKTSDDWWTCKDDNSRQGLVPANYVQEL